jgi:membrane protease YdiL (CAAX protease family)
MQFGDMPSIREYVLNNTIAGMKVSFLEVSFLLFWVFQCASGIPAIRRRKNLPFPGITLGKRHAAAIAATAANTVLALLVAAQSGIPVFGSSRIGGESLLLGLAFLIAVLCLDPIEWKFTSAENRKQTATFLPRTARERVSWVFVCISTGVGEEIIHRAVLFGILFRITGEYWIAACVSAALFALHHCWQGRLAVASAFCIAICLQWMVKISEGLYLAIAFHFMHNCINGILWGILIKPENEPAECSVSSPVPTDVTDLQTQA